MMTKLIYDKHDVMRELGISEPTLFRMIKGKKIPPPFKFGSGTSANRWRREDILNYINEKATNPTTSS